MDFVDCDSMRWNATLLDLALARFHVVAMKAIPIRLPRRYPFTGPNTPHQPPGLSTCDGSCIFGPLSRRQFRRLTDRRRQRRNGTDGSGTAGPQGPGQRSRVMNCRTNKNSNTMMDK
ncbi:hypothetical protein BGZ65_010495 [Modicella reniformis]|uniref:Uncharacterized protein n=1 Tax=Modicella reniformis TaxID=1440133 RepID=A0A9P6JGG8_9FUNG|nr:hypothetical protein BGZ65_010495 [Modicella reniformis]